MPHKFKSNARISSLNRKFNSEIGFHPDEWQVDLLNVISNNESALVVAPTSAGKSFSSLFVIKHLFGKQNTAPTTTTATSITKDESTIKSNKIKMCANVDLKPQPFQLTCQVVFVTPSKALLNQTTFDIHNYLDKHGINKTVGSFSADFQHNLTSCDILVCTPLMLRILLLSPHQEAWAENTLRFAVFDEIHEISRKKLVVKKCHEKKVICHEKKGYFLKKKIC